MNSIKKKSLFLVSLFSGVLYAFAAQAEQQVSIFPPIDPAQQEQKGWFTGMGESLGSMIEYSLPYAERLTNRTSSFAQQGYGTAARYVDMLARMVAQQAVQGLGMQIEAIEEEVDNTLPALKDKHRIRAELSRPSHCLSSIDFMQLEEKASSLIQQATSCFLQWYRYGESVKQLEEMQRDSDVIFEEQQLQ